VDRHDAAGHQHFTAILRWAEQAELLLHERLGISDVTLGRCPRVRVGGRVPEAPLAKAVVDVEIAVKRVGRSSVVYDSRFGMTARTRPAGHDRGARRGRRGVVPVA